MWLCLEIIPVNYRLFWKIMLLVMSWYLSNKWWKPSKSGMMSCWKSPGAHSTSMRRRIKNLQHEANQRRSGPVHPQVSHWSFGRGGLSLKFREGWTASGILCGWWCVGFGRDSCLDFQAYMRSMLIWPYSAYSSFPMLRESRLSFKEPSRKNTPCGYRLKMCF